MNILGIAIGGTKSAISYAEYNNGDIVLKEKITIKTNPDSDKETLKLIFDEIKNKKYIFEYISIISGGPLDTKKGIIECPPHLPGFKNTPIVDIFKNKFNVPVDLLNDADACALAEYKFGAGKNSSNMAYITFGTGIGAGLILSGKLYTGNNSMAGEIGHIKLTESGPIGYGKSGSVEGWCAGGNIYKWANISNINNTKELFELARKGNKNATTAINILSKRLGEAISVLIDTLNLDTIVLGGIYPRNLDLLEFQVYSAAKENSIPSNFSHVKIIPSKLGEKIDDYSALMGVYQNENMKTFYDHYPELLDQKKNIENAIEILVNCYKNGGKILVCGNGGSASDSAHIVGELMKGFMSKRSIDSTVAKKISNEFQDSNISNKLQTGIPCIDLTAQSSLLSAFANDVDPDLIYAQEVLGYSANSKNDVVIGLSTSGNSKNVVSAIKVAKALGLKTISLTGKNESKLSENSTICIKAPETETYKIQEYHLPIYHYICQELEKKI